MNNVVYINIDFLYFRSITRVWAETSVFRFKLSYDFVHLTDYFPPYLAFSLSFLPFRSLWDNPPFTSLPSLNFAIVPEPSLPKKLWLYVGDKLTNVKLPSWEHYHGEQFHTTWPPRMRIVPPFGLRFTNAAKSFTKKSMEISLTLSKIVLFLLKRQYVRISPNPILNLSVYLPNTQRIANSQRRWNFVLFWRHPPYIFSKIVHSCAAEQEKNKFQVARV